MSIASFANHRYRRLRNSLRGEPEPKRFTNIVDFQLEERRRAKAEELAERGVEPRAVRGPGPEDAA